MNYITNPKCNLKPPPKMHSFIDQNTWDKFPESRKTHEFQAKSQIGKENNAKNIYPYKLSCGGYEN